MKRSNRELQEPMVYILAAIKQGIFCGIDIINSIDQLTHGRVQMGPATFYALLDQLLEYQYINYDGAFELSYEVKKRGEDALEEYRMWTLDWSSLTTDHNFESPKENNLPIVETRNNSKDNGLAANEEQKMKHYYRFPVCPHDDVESMESWLSDMAAQGYYPSEDDNFCGAMVIFIKGDPAKVRYRLVSGKQKTNVWSDVTPNEDTVKTYAYFGWNYVGYRDRFCIYSTTKEDARELYMDPKDECRSLSKVRYWESNTLHYFLIYILCFTIGDQRNTFLINMMETSSFLYISGLGLILYGLALIRIKKKRLHRLEDKILNMGALDHNKDWHKQQKLYYIRIITETALIIAWFIYGGICIYNHTEHNNSQSIAAYKEEIPFAVLNDFSVPDKCIADIGDIPTGEISERHDLLASKIIHWDEKQSFTMGDGTTETHKLSISYYEMRSPLLAKELVREYKKKSSRGEEEIRFSLDKLHVDYAIAYDSGTLTTVIIRKGKNVLCTNILQYNESYRLAPEELVTIAAKEMTN